MNGIITRKFILLSDMNGIMTRKFILLCDMNDIMTRKFILLSDMNGIMKRVYYTQRNVYTLYKGDITHFIITIINLQFTFHVTCQLWSSVLEFMFK